MNSEQMNNNFVEIWGKVVSKPQYSHSVLDEKFFEFALEVPRLSDSSDTIPITISEKLISKEIEINNVIGVVGQFRSYNKVIDDKSRLMLTVFVREIYFDIDTNKNPNSIFLSGYICKLPIYRITPFKREICDVLLAVNRSFNKSDYIPLIAWGRNARFVKNLEVGTMISIEGRIQSRLYQKKLDDGQVETKTAYEISVTKLRKEDVEETNEISGEV